MPALGVGELGSLAADLARLRAMRMDDAVLDADREHVEVVLNEAAVEVVEAREGALSAHLEGVHRPPHERFRELEAGVRRVVADDEDTVADTSVGRDLRFVAPGDRIRPAVLDAAAGPRLGVAEELADEEPAFGVGQVDHVATDQGGRAAAAGEEIALCIDHIHIELPVDEFAGTAEAGHRLLALFAQMRFRAVEQRLRTSALVALSRARRSDRWGVVGRDRRGGQHGAAQHHGEDEGLERCHGACSSRGWRWVDFRPNGGSGV